MTQPQHRPSALFVADSDSYLKWGVGRLLEASDRWDCELVVVASAVTPSASQVEAAVAGRIETPATVSIVDLERRLRADPPEILVLACRGDLIALLLEDRLRGTCAARVIVAGIPGVWLPPTELGLTLRRSVDLMVVHSHVERDAVDALLPRTELRATGLASLAIPDIVRAEGANAVVFAPQALVPAAREDRRRLLAALVDLARSRPDLSVVVKTRGAVGEAQTHRDDQPYEELLAEAGDVPTNLAVETGPMTEHLARAVGFVTVSSTAALEAVAAGVPSLCIADFGVGPATLTTAFEGSGLLGSLEDLRAGAFREPDAAWLARSYFHPVDDNDWMNQVDALAQEPRAGAARELPRAGLRTRVRRRWVALGDGDPTPARHLSHLIGLARSASAGVARLRRTPENG
ncbi:DUF6716 putative glycosyltransferase [Demequina gelatinilytica]|uniref:DUF6716 putative glycosyltransferase n=1 Tax=Demequina gelatinilytica TaxID=1638980 RepID=UPI0007840685|nr:DUF6716 putative glycosyltransferase [Demequina gelatinilytica]